MIVTLTANPALDRTIALAEPLREGDVQQALSAREDAGGKGINVARVISAAGNETLAVLPLGLDDPFARVLRATGVPTRTIDVAGATRINTAITDAAGTTTKLNLPGAELDASERTRVIDAVVAASRGARWVVLAGSLPPGAGAQFYVDVIRAVRESADDTPPSIAVDTSGEALSAVVRASRPDLIKPNEEELAELCGLDPRELRESPEAAARAGRAIVPERVGAALITLGGRGAILVDDEGALGATPPPTHVVSTVGAGDSSLAGYLLAESSGATRAERLRHAIRYGAAAASLPGTQTPGPQDLSTADIDVRTIELPA